MKDFLKFTLATVTGIILSSIVLFIIGMVTPVSYTHLTLPTIQQV